MDAVAFHWYGASSPNAAAAANSFLNRVDWYHTRFNRPVWITEFAMHDWEGDDPTEAMIQANAEFLEIVIPQLEARSYVERYSYYNWFDDARVFDTDNDRMPTVIGDQYVDTLLPGESKDVATASLSTDIVYLRGGQLVNTGAAAPDAVRALDALGGVSTIAADADWSLTNTRNSYTRVRSGTTLLKAGPAQIELLGGISNQGNIQIEEGSLHFVDGVYSGGGKIEVHEGASIKFTFQGGRGVYPLQNTELELAGQIDGPVRLLSDSILTTKGTSAETSNALFVRDSVVEIGGPGFESGPPIVVAVTAGLQLDYDASLDQPGDNIWESNVGASSPLTFGGSVTPFSIQDPSWPGISAAYSISSTGESSGLNQYFEGGANGQRSRQDATFEVVFHVDDTSAGDDQVLLEVGGAGSGVAFVLNNDTLKFNVDGIGGDIDLTQTLTTGWHHAVGVIDLTSETDSVMLFVNGQQVGIMSGQNINDWAGGNIAGLGGGANSVTGVSSGVGQPFHGDLAIARYYENNALNDSDVLQNYQALTTAGLGLPSQLTVQGDLLAEAGSELRLDIGDNGASDKLIVSGTLSLSGTTLSISSVGQGELAVGDVFDLLDVGSLVGGFDEITLPELQSGLRWRTDDLSVDGTIQIVLTGDFNSDGHVDASDYTV